ALSPVVVSPVPGSTAAPKVSAYSSATVYVNGAQGMVVTKASTNSDINSDAGSIVLTSTTGLLQIASSGRINANGGSITIENLDATGTGSIKIGASAQLHASSTVADVGHVYVIIGKLPTVPQSGPSPASVQMSETDGGQVFIGASGITAGPGTSK